MKINFTKVAVVLFIIVLSWAAYDARADDGFRFSLGYTVANSTLPFGSVSYEWKDMELDATLIGQGSTKRGDQDVVKVFSLSHIVRPSWTFLGATNYYRIGVSYQDGSPLVGSTNFRLGIGLEWKVLQVEYVHYSSAGIHRPNSGIDGIQLRFKTDM
jgi:hypothetical protein